VGKVRICVCTQVLFAAAAAAVPRKLGFFFC
jgi:hypothetical protein